MKKTEKTPQTPQTATEKPKPEIKKAKTTPQTPQTPQTEKTPQTPVKPEQKIPPQTPSAPVETPAETIARLQRELKAANTKISKTEQERDKLKTAIAGGTKCIALNAIADLRDIVNEVMETVEQRGRNIRQFKYYVVARTDRELLVIDEAGDPIMIPLHAFNEAANTVRDSKGVNADYFIRPMKKATPEAAATAK